MGEDDKELAQGRSSLLGEGMARQTRIQPRAAAPIMALPGGEKRDGYVIE